MEPTSWATAIGNLVREFGLSVTLVIVLVCGGGYAIYKVWSFITPLITSLFERHAAFLDVLSANDTKHTEAMQTLTNEGRQGHEKTHAKLDTAHLKLDNIAQRLERK